MQELINKKYDFIFSLGEACACTQVLRKCRLQFASFPFDWLYGSNINKRAELISNDMENWFNIEDLEKIGQREHPEPKDIYKNNKTGIVFNHDFPINGELKNDYEKVKEKYDRRINRLLENIRNSNNVLVVYIQNPNQREIVTDENLLFVQSILQKRFQNTTIHLLYLYCERSINYKNRKLYYLNENTYKLIFDYDGYNEELPYVVNFKLLYKIFNKFKISNKFLTSKNINNRINYKILVFVKDLLNL